MLNSRAGGPDISADAVASSVRGRDGKRRSSSPTLRSNFRPLGRFFGGGVGSTCPPGLETTSEAEGRADRRAGTMSAETSSGPTQDQVEILEYNFNKVNKHPDPTTLCLIAAEAGLSEEETQKWFKQRLAQWRRSEGLPSECRSVTD
ncbi:homeodomain-only protein isoform X1 [Mustela putorius furo]|uniref:Homeodomain-only protein n=2 Tax=Mustela putorius furo TaxID=9669 RepID=A0A8U0S664_MUSPF|nr:homeodomain-only protein isoform X1 [Mustela putorius furo]